jgi:hypothetical protein
MKKIAHLRSLTFLLAAPGLAAAQEIGALVSNQYMDAAKFAAAQAAGKTLPGPHNSRFEPNPEPALRTGVTAMSSVAIALLQ